MLINLGRLAMFGVWVFLVLNLVNPFPRPLDIFLDVALAFMVLMHGLQMMMFKATQPKDAPPMSKGQQLRIFLFGVFELLAWNKAQKKQP